ncbi:MAG TPA: ABC transporter permease [Blastocatellia bacterium]|nr:ABC transporter permease [Blastocatellia bacterium]
MEAAREAEIIEELTQHLEDRYNECKHAVLSIIVIARLTLGIGITTGVFAYCNAAGLRAPVDKDFDSFVRVYSAYTKDPLRPGSPGETTLEDYLAFRDRTKSMRSLAASSDIYVSLGQDDPREVRALLVTSDFFSVYDVEQPLMGRLLQPEDDASANPVGQTFQDRDGHLFEVIGVAGDVSSTRLGALDGPPVYQPCDLNQAREGCAFVRFDVCRCPTN